MDEVRNSGGAGPAIAAHSKDGSTPGPTPASQAAGETRQATGAPEAKAWTGQAQQAAERVTSSLSDTTRWLRENVAVQGGEATKQAADLVRRQPLAAVAVTGAVCLVIGMLIGRR